MCLHSTSLPSSGAAKTLTLLASILSIAAETEQDGASGAMLLVWQSGHVASVAVLLVRQNGHDGTLVVVQAKVSPSTFAWREALIEQQQEQQAAVASLAVLPGCNRTADMQYEFVVGLHVLQTFWQACPQAVVRALRNINSGTGADCFHSYCMGACPWKSLIALQAASSAASRITLCLLMLGTASNAAADRCKAPHQVLMPWKVQLPK